VPVPAFPEETIARLFASRGPTAACTPGTAAVMLCVSCGLIALQPARAMQLARAAVRANDLGAIRFLCMLFS
jgi:hypothetical protein